MQLNYAEYQHIYTDGSKDKERVGCAVLRENDHQTMRIPDGSSIFTAEAKAIDLALDLVDNCNSHDKFIIFSDSFSVLQALNHTSSKNPQIQNILQKHHTISKYKTIVYCWIPSHIGIRNNERVDKKAKESLNLEQTVFKIPFNKPRAGPGVERIGRTPPPLAQSVETWPIGVRLVCRELRPVSLEERILVIERVGCGRHATHYFGLNFS